MANYVYVLTKGMDMTPGGKDESKVPESERLGQEEPLEKRVDLLVETTCYTVFAYIAQGLFERHKLIVATQLCMSILKSKGDLQFLKFDYLLRGPKVMGVDNPLGDWISDSVWGSVQALKELDDYQSLADDLIGSSKRWREWIELERPEDEPLPGDWKRMPEFDRLLLFRALRPDRLTSAMSRFVTGLLGSKYVSSQPFDLERSYQVRPPSMRHHPLTISPSGHFTMTCSSSSCSHHYLIAFIPSSGLCTRRPHLRLPLARSRCRRLCGGSRQEARLHC